jgi:hypothetical protein
VRIAALLLAVLVLAGCGAGTQTVTLTTTVTQPAAAPGPQSTTYFGQPVAITGTPESKQLLLVLRPQSYLVGVTANSAFGAQQGKRCAPLSCPGVGDDRLVVPAGSQPLTFVLSPKTTGTVLTLKHGTMQTTKVSAAQLAALASGAKQPKLVEPLASGLWIAVNVDKITSFAQQFQP